MLNNEKILSSYRGRIVQCFSNPPNVLIWNFSAKTTKFRSHSKSAQLDTDQFICIIIPSYPWGVPFVQSLPTCHSKERNEGLWGRYIMIETYCWWLSNLQKLFDHLNSSRKLIGLQSCHFCSVFHYRVIAEVVLGKYSI